ncbi:MAG: UDP-N-acetylmuramoyl-L-alanyl-D-glutamate--2,6-diaminopimelate ligase [Flavobacteriales bacterium]|jgi:UDP-N-acetylmuramoyl-L-alanyl-D-glutamate--2,6-diaminopimelate ligase|tara:strand:- start:7439 stop:8893 length:1455 start_codon:yes stop_codon:yes gene_type:complete
MKLLKDILYKVELESISGNVNIAIPHICFDSRIVQKDSLFVAVKGSISDGHTFIENAISLGALAVICEKLPTLLKPEVVYIKVKDAATALGIIAANFYDNPSEKIKLIGVTGTNGKTTVATLLHNLFQALGYKAGLLSTVVYKIGSKSITATHTTPDALRLNAMLKEMISEGCKYCFMEVSSHAIDQGRVTGLNFDIALFTNISRDHLDYHKTFDEYILAKKKLFDSLGANSIAIVNKDDKHGETMLHHTKANKKYFALRSMADYKCKIIESQFGGLHLNVNGQEVYTKLIGSFNASNLLLTFAAAVELGEDSLQVLTVLSALNAVEGRFQQYKSDSGITAIVDYAHTPDALDNVLKTIADIRTGNQKLVCVVGCGGDRDAGKRPLMAEVACTWSDQVILTSDNPRSEEPMAIIEEMKTGVSASQMKKVLSLDDRREAIKLGIALCSHGDILLIAGKGHEKYQEIKGERFPFDDLAILKEHLKD